MQVTFKNTGMIEAADIRFDGLTVIAGENDTGKSTIGKLMFSIIKTFNRYPKEDVSNLKGKIQDLLEDYYSTFRQKDTDAIVSGMGKTFFEELKKEILGMLDNGKSDGDINAYISDRASNFSETVNQVSSMPIGLETLPERVVELITEKKKNEDILETSFRDIMSSVFSGEIVNKFAINQKYTISGNDGKDKTFEISGTNESVDIQLYDKPYFEDATFVESPILLNLSETIRFSKTILDVASDRKKKVDLLKTSYVPEYMKDFILKVTDRILKKSSSEAIDNIREIIGGDFNYNQIEHDFVFEKGKESFKGLSIASGIKYLGSLGILLQAGFLNKKSLLILDEPETNVHPLWQIRFAEMLVQLVKEGNYILLTSHSSYFIEALKVYSNYSDIKKKTAFYVSKKSKTGFTSNIIDVTDDVSPIFELLAEPYDILETIQAEHIT